MERVSLRKGNRLTTKCSTLTWNTTPCTNIRQGCRTSGISDILDCPQPQVKRSRRSCVFFVVSFDIVYLQTVLFRKSFTSLRRVERRKGSGRVSLLHGTLVAGGDHLSGVRHFRFNFIQLTITMNKLAFCHNVSKCIVEYCNCMQQSANNMKMILLSHLFSFLLPVFCRFFEADLALQEQSIPGAAPLSNLGETKMLTRECNIRFIKCHMSMEAENTEYKKLRCFTKFLNAISKNTRCFRCAASICWLQGKHG